VRKICIIEVSEDSYLHMRLNGCEDKLEELLSVVEKLVSLRLAGVELDEVELMELFYVAEDLYNCVNGDGYGAEDSQV